MLDRIRSKIQSIWGSTAVKELDAWGYPGIEDSSQYGVPPTQIKNKWGYPPVRYSSVIPTPPTPPTPPIPTPWGLINPAVSATNTIVSNDLGADGYTWAQGHPLTIDQYGKYVVLQQRNGGTLSFMYSNDSGVTWTDSLVQLYITRGCVAYDSINDIFHVLWAATNNPDGIIYRRYLPTRDASHNITAIVRDMTINLQLDYETSATCILGHPVLLWLPDIGVNGGLVAAWSARQTGTAPTGLETRTSMRVLSNSADDNTAANWKAPVSASVSTVATAPQVPYTAIAVSASTLESFISINRKVSGTHALDLYVAYSVSGSSLNFKRLTWNPATEDWSSGMTAAILLTNITRSGVDAGYQFKAQIVTEPRETTDDKMVVAFSTWKDNAAGDTWSYVSINPDDTINPIVDVYEATAAESAATKFVTGDVVCDSGNVVLSYTTLPNKEFYVRAFNSLGVEILAPVLVYALPTDIPLLYQLGLSARVGGKLLINFRDFNAEATDTPPVYTPPYTGYFGTMEWL